MSMMKGGNIGKQIVHVTDICVALGPVGPKLANRAFNALWFQHSHNKTLKPVSHPQLVFIKIFQSADDTQKVEEKQANLLRIKKGCCTVLIMWMYIMNDSGTGTIVVPYIHMI